MRQCKNPKVPASLSRLERRFAAWREKRAQGQRIPTSLWKSAVDVAVEHGVSRTASLLKLDYYALKKRVEQNAGSAVAQQGPATAGKMAARAEFLELPVAAWPGVGECTLELEDAGGAKLRVHLKGFAAPDLTALSRSFWQSES